MLDYQVEKNIVDCNSMGTIEHTVKDNTSAMDDSHIDQVLKQVNIASNNEFKTKLNEDWQEAASDGQLLSVLMCEVDFYDEYVTSNGLQGAYFMLMVVALALKNICEQQGAFLAHFNQQKFAIVIKGGDHKEVFDTSERLCKAVENTKTAHHYSRVSKFVTISIGVSITAPQLKNSLMDSVGNALQNAKITGRNRVSNDLSERKIAETVNDTAISHTVTQQPAAPKANDLAPMSDRSAAVIEQLEKKTYNKSKMYRGHDLFAESKEEVKEEAKPAVRMYRGHPIV